MPYVFTTDFLATLGTPANPFERSYIKLLATQPDLT